MTLQCMGILLALLQLPKESAADVSALRAKLQRPVKLDIDTLGLRKFATTVSQQHDIAVEISAVDLRSLGLTDEIRLSLQAEQPLDRSIWQFLVMRSEHLTCVLREKGAAGAPALVVTTWKGAQDRGETPEMTAAHARAIAELLHAPNSAEQYRAIVVLGRFGKHAADASSHMETFLRSPDKSLRDAAEKSLKQIRGD